MPWPLSQDYNEAVQSPKSNFADPDLRRGEAVCNALGIPIPYSGNFADVYQVRCPDGKSWAVKCFTREAVGLRERYAAISAHLRQAKLPFMVDFTYLEQGMRVAGTWYPALKMQWVEGLTLNQFVAQYLDKPAMLDALSQIWGRMAQYLRTAEVGHCDLQHGNVLLVPGASANSLALKLIDYDGMWVPALAGKKSGEVGHPSYQHPRRPREQSYSIDVDRFPSLLIAAALRALRVTGRPLWDKYDNGDNLLFRESDLLAPLQSRLFLDLTRTADAAIDRMIDALIRSLRGSLEAVPLLEEVMPEIDAPPSPSAAPRPAKPTMMRPAPAATTVPAAPAPWDFDAAASDASAGRPSRNWRKRRRGVPAWAWIAAFALLTLGAAASVAALLSMRNGFDDPTRAPKDKATEGGQPAPARFVSLESFAHHGQFVAGGNFLGVMSRPDTAEDRRNATFEIVPGLADEDLISFRPVSSPKYYLVHEGFRVRLRPREDSDEYRRHGTFRQVKGLGGGGGASFEALNYPGFYIHARGEQLFIDQFDGSAGFQREATFAIVSPLFKAGD